MMARSVEDQIDVLIVNDSQYMTKLLTDLISGKNIHVSNTARDGLEALRKISIESPDVILLDLEMPKMDGLTFIEHIVKQKKLVPIIVVSSFSQDGAKLVLDALENGALDFVPISQTNSDSLDILRDNLISKIEVAAKSDTFQLITKNIEKLKPREKPVVSSGAASKVVVIGASTGGPKVVQYILSQIPEDLDAGILVVQHMPKEFTGKFAERLDETSNFIVKEAKDGEIIKNGTVLVAPGDYHMIVDPSYRIRLITGPKRFGVRPAVNMTMVSASEVFGANTIGVLLTGMGHDGGFGMKTIKKRGGRTIAQDSRTAVVYGMPKAAVDLNAVDKSLSIENIPHSISEEVESLARK